MSVVKGKRSESKLEFDNAYYKVYNDAVEATAHNLITKEMTYEDSKYIWRNCYKPRLY